MKYLQILMTIFAVGVFGLNAAAQVKRTPPQRTQPPIKIDRDSLGKEETFKVLLEESNSGAEEPFVFVARNAAQFAELTKLAGGLSSAAAIDFEQTAVVAAFAGTRSTAGYSIQFSKTADGVKINLSEPPKGAMTAQVLTAPAKIVLVPVEPQNGLQIELGHKIWQSKLKTYRVSTGKMEFSGGFIGKQVKFSLAGTIKLMRSGDLVTVFFNVNSKTKSTDKTADTATGNIKGKTSITFERVDAGSLIEKPRPPLTATGDLTAKKLTLKFESLPTNIADGFQGSGTLEAVLIK